MEFQLHHQSYQLIFRMDLVRMDWLDLLAVLGTLKSHHSSKASILQCSAFFTAKLSHPYVTTGETIALSRWTFVGKVMCLLFNMLSRLVIIFLPRSKCILISWLQSTRQWQPTPVLFPGKSHGQRSLVGCCLWGLTESDTTKVTYQQQPKSEPCMLRCFSHV